MTNVHANGPARRLGGPHGISLARCKAALRKHAGVFSLAALELGVSRQAIYQRVQRSPELQRVVQDIEETLLDAVDAGIADLIINKRDPATIRWYADRKGRGRGYGTGGAAGERASLSQPIEVIITYVEPDGTRHLEALD